MKAFYTDHFVLPLPEGHRFPMAKYRMVREQVGDLPGLNLVEAPPATDTQLLLAHDPVYVQRVITGTLAPQAQREIGFPWSPGMVERSRRSVGATIAASRVALEDGIAVNLAGGTHHAYRDKGSGFCVFNDAAVAARVMQRSHGIERIAIIDLDVHQGNGTASILRRDASIFTLSLHGEKNFPFRKEPSDLDIGLPDGCTDAEYLAALENALDALSRRFKPDLLIYLAGADPHEADRLGRLKLSFAGLKARDERVLEFAKSLNIGVAITMAGGYGTDINNTVRVHVQTIAAALGYWKRNATKPLETSA
ncbi:MAG: histone deacetylase [Burkholderiaceae bacterium]|nr:histone deacetylase [Burkholderiaceae bacterium]MCD8564779.1 histone deacetylase [Burkholderiaceae bacterium]